MDLMLWGSRRGLAAGERGALSEGLLAALAAAGVEPVIVARPAFPALLAGLWRRQVPVMVLGRCIYLPGAAQDFSPDLRRMAVLQHELQHVLEFGTGELSRLGYLLRPRNWRYGYVLTPDAVWADFGAEQRAMLAQHYFLAERGQLKDSPPLEKFRSLIPWAR